MMPFSTDTSLWRISTLPTKAPEIVFAIQKFMDSVAFYDWSGALICWKCPPPPTLAPRCAPRRRNARRPCDLDPR